MEITIRMGADEMLDAAARGLLESLAKCGKKEEPQVKLAEKSVQPDISSEQVAAQAAQTVPMQEAQDITVQSSPQTAVPVVAPAVPVQDIPAAVPTQQVTYSQEDLALAATQLVDAGKLQQVQDLLAKFGVQALTLLPKEQYGAFAAELRNMGAKI